MVESREFVYQSECENQKAIVGDRGSGQRISFTTVSRYFLIDCELT